ncbi:LysE family transporter [Streptomyces sp. ASQP_92]|uniref:LysE family transporter n=1 Tax=Streptomyces sp. ASQP_92 TaxID=2979116 RepID=UPI0021BFC96F|nr:LysE family transporter [Streptomyces sp. ASQP_92]MCT9087830.1 LysE family transporter [Streptomyces sp. ASQP_92]
MSELWATAMAGAAAGLGVAVPVGAVGVLLIQEGMRERRGAMAAAAAVATVDLVYAALATALGPLVAAALSGVEAWVRLVSALVLAAIAGHGLWVSRRPARKAGGAPSSPPSPTRKAGEAPSSPPSPARKAGGAPSSPPSPARKADGAPSSPPSPARKADGAPSSPSSPARDAHTAPAGPVGPEAAHTAPAGPARTFARFTALTLINPTTALYFAALTTARGSSLSGGTAGAVFVAGVFAASFLWQQFLVAASGFAGARISPAARAWTFRAGYGLVALYAVKVALPLP